MVLKDGVSIEGCRPEILIAAITIIAPIFQKHNRTAVITSGTEKVKHSAKRSAHYRGDALDFRNRYFPTVEKKAEVLQDLSDGLGPNFVVVLESTHYHIHYAPVFEA
jgi:hypothetical protein